MDSNACCDTGICGQAASIETTDCLLYLRAQIRNLLKSLFYALCVWETSTHPPPLRALLGRLYVVDFTAGIALPLIVTKESEYYPTRFLAIRDECTLTVQGP